MTCLHGANRTILSTEELNQMRSLIKRYLCGGDISESEKTSMMYQELSAYVPKESRLMNNKALSQEFFALCKDGIKNIGVLFRLSCVYRIRLRVTEQ